VPAITVTRVCSCGCGSIDFEVDAERAPSNAWDGHWGPIVEVFPPWLMLFQADGWLTELEHVPEEDGREDLACVDPAQLRPDPQVEDGWFEER
jgi:hypothetical protein